MAYALLALAVRNTFSMCDSRRENCPMRIEGEATPEAASAAPKMRPLDIFDAASDAMS
jgi:hypothetical protein